MPLEPEFPIRAGGDHAGCILTTAPAVFEVLLNSANAKQAINAIKTALGPNHPDIWALNQFKDNIP